MLGHAIAQAVSCQLPTMAARVRAQVRSCGICGGQRGTGGKFSQVLRFPLPILIPLTAPHSSSSITQGWYNRPNCGQRTKCPQSYPTPRRKRDRRTCTQPCSALIIFTQSVCSYAWNNMRTARWIFILSEHLCMYLKKYLSERKMFQTKVVEKNRAHFISSTLSVQVYSILHNSTKEWVHVLTCMFIIHGLWTVAIKRTRWSLMNLDCIKIKFVLVFLT
jgi:hypothetical protein